MSKLELEIIPRELTAIQDKLASIPFPNSTPGGAILMEINALRKKLEPYGYSIGVPSDRYGGVPKLIKIIHPTKSYVEISKEFDAYCASRN